MPRKKKETQSNDLKNLTNNDTQSLNFTQQGELSQEEIEKISDEFVVKFARSVANGYLNMQPFFNPYLQNQILKDINMNPHEQDRDKIEELLKNPSKCEKELRGVSQYLTNKIMQYRQLINHYSTMLTFDYTLEPTNADEEDMRSDKFKKSYNKVSDWLDDFSLKKTFQEVVQGIVLEETKYYYVRESKEGVRLQEMPSNFCKILRKTDYGYQYAFDMMYFFRFGIDFNDYAPEFKEYYVEFLKFKDVKEDKDLPEGVRREYSNGVYAYWKELNPLKAPVFKYDETVGGSVPPFAPLFTNAMDISTYNDLFKSKTEADIWKMLINKLPMHKDAKGGENTKNNFALDATIAGKFTSIMQSILPSYVRAVTVPFEDTQVVDFSQSANQNAILNAGNKMFWQTSTSSEVIFGGESPNASGLKASLISDESFIEKFYRQAERFINLQLRQISGRYRWKIHFEGTKYDDITNERFNKAIQACQVGCAHPHFIGSSLHMTPRQFDNMMAFSRSQNYPELLKPLLSSHTQSGDDNGRPETSDSKLTDSGEKTRDRGDNTEKII